MRVAVLGAAGTIAPAIVRDLALSDEVDGLVLLDIDDAKAEQVASLHGGTKARAALADARATPDDPSSLARALQGCDVLVNAASYRVNLDAMAACLRVGCHYLDLGGLYWMTELQTELAPQFERQGLLAVLGIGSAPGKTNLMAKLAVQELQAAGDGAAPAGNVESIDVSAAGRDLDPPAGFSVPYALRTLLDELTMRPVVLHGGHAEEIDPYFAFGAPHVR
jgi:saccharopine dehydrogenase-like NADP-dependent oxidoreductase